MRRIHEKEKERAAIRRPEKGGRMSRRKFPAAAALLVALALVATACGGGDDNGNTGQNGALKAGGIFRVQTDAFEWTGGLDPTGEYLGWAFEFFGALHRTLVGYNHKPGDKGGNDVVPDAAENLGDVSSDGLTYTFKIKKGVKFQAPLNRQVTSKDYKNAFKRLANATFNATGYPTYYLSTIVGMQDMADGKAQDISGIETPDDSTIIFKLTRPTGDFRYRLAMPAAAPMPEEVTKCITKAGEYGRFQMASGPYMIEGSDKIPVGDCAAMTKAPASGFNPETHLRLRRNAAYDKSTDKAEYRSNYIDGVDLTKNTNTDDIFKKIEEGTVDGESANPPAPVIQKGLTDPNFKDNFKLDPGDRTWYLSLNLALPPFDDLAVRKAANFVMDKAGLVKVRGGSAAGVVAEHIVPPDVLGGRLKVGEFNPYGSPNGTGDATKAAEEMKKSKYDTNKDGKCDESAACKDVLFITRSTPIYRDMAPIVADSLAKIGIKLVTRQVENFYKAVQVTANTPPIGGGAGWGKDYADASTFFEPLLHSGAIKKEATQNYSLLGITTQQVSEYGVKAPAGLNIPSADADIDKCSKLLDKERADCWAELDKKMMNEYVPWIPYLWAVNQTVISDAVLNYTYDQFAGEVSFVHIAIDVAKQKQ
jgi:peptide/nickel transport system substrate-binding protein